MRIGITGGIGSGKSTVSSYLKEKGFFIIDADQIGRDIAKKGSPVLAKLSDAFGKDVLDEEGCLRRQYLAEIVFCHKEKKQLLDSIMLVEIINTIDRLFDEHKDEIIILDAPLLFEAGLAEKMDFSVVIVADKVARANRVVARDNVEFEHVLSRMENQMSDEEKISIADEVIRNDGTKEELYLEVDKVLKKHEIY